MRTEPDRRTAFIEHLVYVFDNLVDRYADSHSLTAAHSAGLLDVSRTQALLGCLQWHAASNDAGLCLRLGGPAHHRGRAEFRHDPDSPHSAGVLALHDERGNDHFLWVEMQGKLLLASVLAFLAGRPDRNELLERLRQVVLGAARSPDNVAKSGTNQPPEAGDVRSEV